MRIRANILAAALAIAGLVTASGPDALAQPATAPSTISLDDAFKTFDWKTHRLIVALPPGIESSGPYSIEATLLGDGAPFFKSELKLAADQPTNRMGLPADAYIVRLSPDAAWPQQIADVQKAMEDSKAKFQPGKRSMEFQFQFKTSLNPESRDRYCSDNARVPPPIVLLERGSQIQRLDLSDFAGALVQMMKNACKTPQPS